MRYFIFEEGQTWEVPETSYPFWHDKHAADYKLPDYEVVTADHVYSVESMYIGSIDKGEAVLPFILLCIVDKIVIHRDKLRQKYKNENVEYFATFEEYKKGYYELKEELQLKK